MLDKLYIIYKIYTYVYFYNISITIIIKWMSIKQYKNEYKTIQE